MSMAGIYQVTSRSTDSRRPAGVRTRSFLHITHTRTHTCKHAELIHPSTRPLARPTHNPSVTHEQTHKRTLQKKQLIGLMMMTELALSKWLPCLHTTECKVRQCERVITTHI